MKPKPLNFLQDLLSTPSPSGWERVIQEKWLAYVKPYADEVQTDAYGNAVAILNPGGSPVITLIGHGDEIGFQVQHISEEGFIYFVGIGGVDHALALGQRVTIYNQNGPVNGVIGSLPIHLQDKTKERGLTPMHEIFIDIGVSSRKEALKKISIGDPITYSAVSELLNEDVIIGRGIDNRMGIFAVAEALRLCHESRKKLKACIIAISTIQEENGAYGARMLAGVKKMDAALVVDVGHATDIPLCDARKFGQVKLGKGPMLCRGSVNHPVLVERLQKIAKKQNIDIQMATNARMSSTDADEIFVGQGGIPTAVVKAPNRYMHSPVEMIHLKDLERLSQLLAAFALDAKEKESFHLQVNKK